MIMGFFCHPVLVARKLIIQAFIFQVLLVTLITESLNKMTRLIEAIKY